MFLLLSLCVLLKATTGLRLTTPAFLSFMDKHEKQYETEEEHNKRFWVFYQNTALWKKANQEDSGSAVYGATQFADITEQEFADSYLNKVMMDSSLEDMTSLLPKVSDIDTSDVPDAVDWREKNAVTPVKNQGMCGSCWAFSTTGNVEGQFAIQTGELASLSEQELVDCDKVDSGCNGGLPSQAYLEIKRIGGLELESDYPYSGHGASCHFNKTMAKVEVSGGLQLPVDEAKIAAWVAANGPVSIGINAFMMQFYMGGVAHPWKYLCRPSQLDHGVLITGYGVDNGVPFWNIKNSWSEKWGEKGYYRIYRGANCCGVSEMVTSATL